MNGAGSAHESLPRRLALPALWLIAVNGMIGAGIFGLPADLARLVGPAAPWIFVACALLIAPVMLCFARLAGQFDGTGGPLLYVGTAFGPFAGFQAGWAYCAARLTAFAANLNLLCVTLALWWPPADAPAVRLGLMALVCAAMAWMNVAGARVAIGSLGLLTVAKLAPLVGLALWGLSALGAGAPPTAAPAAADLGTAVVLAIYAYVGFEGTLVNAGEARDPRRDIPRALLLALAATAVLYALVQLAVQHLLPQAATAARPVVEAGRALLGPAGAAIVAAAIVASVAGNLLSSMFSTSRITYRLGLDGLLPAWFAHVDARHGTPSNSVWFYAAAGFALAASGSFVWLAVLSVVVRLLLYLGCIAAMPRVRRSVGPGAVALPGGPLVPALAVAVCCALFTQVGWRSVLAAVLLLGVGSVLYLVARRR
jgi:amino acid transporter